MRALRERLVRLWGSLSPGREDDDLEAELRGHLEMAAEAEARRMDPGQDARRLAALREGPLAPAMERLRDQRGTPSLDNVRRDLFYAWRAVVRNPGFLAISSITLGAALALCLTVMTVVNAYSIRSLPYPSSDRLHWVVLTPPGGPAVRGLEAIAWSAIDGPVEHRIAWDLDMFYLLGGAHPESAPGAWVTPGFVPGLGLRAQLGRTLEAGDFEPGAPTAVMISRRLWAARFGSDPDIIGRSIRAYVSDRPDEAEALTIVGVVEDFWHLNVFTDVIGPLRVPAYPYLLRLREGVDAKTVADRITMLVRATNQNLPAGWSAELTRLQERYAAEMWPLLKAVGLSAALVLLIACANVAVLLLVRAARRRHEIAIRLALGASRARLARFLGFEALLLGSTATALGLALSVVLSRALAPVVEQRLGRRLPGGDAALTVDGTVLLVTMGGGIFLTLALTLAPLVTLWSTPVSPALKSGGRGATEGRSARRLRSLLIGTEIAAALALLVGSALLVRSSMQMLAADPGFRASGLLTTSVGLRARAYADPARRGQFYERVLAAFSEPRGGGSAALSTAWPLQQVQPTPVERVGPPGATADAGLVRVTAGYFATLGIPFIDGGPFGGEDRPRGERVAIVSESLARRLWPEGRAVGQQVRLIDDTDRSAPARPQVAHLVVGVVGDVRQLDYNAGRVHADTNVLDVYVPLLQRPGLFAFLYVRGAPHLAESVRTTIAAIEPEAAVQPARHVADMLDTSRRGPRQLAWVLSSFAAFAALLALLGVYSVIAYGVRQREREIGVRLVVGADARAITRLFVREGGAVVAGGLLLGVLGAAALGQVLRSQLFGVEPVDARILTATTAAFALCGWAALWWPARRAACVDPALVLKDE